MAELRFILFIAGLIFLVVLAAWELRRPRQAAPGDPSLRRAPRSEPELGGIGEYMQEAGAAPGSPRSRTTLTPPRLDLVELDEVGVDSVIAATGPQFDPGRAPVNDAPDLTAVAYSAAGADAPVAATLRDRIPEGISVIPEPARAEAASGLAAAAAESEIIAPAPAVMTRSIFVDWPPESRRHIVSLRLVCASPERFSGRAVRLAMTACGFVHGPFGIFHLPDETGRAVISVASLSKPGVLDPVTLDFQRLTGLSLFTVLPGTLPPAAALDNLLEAARELSQRLGARLQDDQGRPLDAGRLEDLRDRMQSLSESGFQAEPAA